VFDEMLSHDYSTLEENLAVFPDDDRVVVVCGKGITSARAAEFLRGQGYDAVSMDEGMEGWGRLHRRHDVAGVDGLLQVVRPGTGCVSYLVHDGERAVVVDPSQYLTVYLEAAADRDLEVVGVVDSHAHADHVSGARRLAGELDVPYHLHGEDVGALDRVSELEDGDAVAVGDRDLEVLHTPGHTPGSVSLRFGDALLSGDTLFLRSVGRPDLEDGSEEAVRTAADRLFDSLDRLAEFDDGTVVLPGHFSGEAPRPVATDLGTLLAESANELLGYVEADDRESFVETVVESLSAEPANYNEIKQINWGKRQPTGEVESIELGPNNCAAN
jgi:glyoxylase-like metal-dependent hydrolase (beta-lactamase superfamily II)